MSGDKFVLCIILISTCYALTCPKFICGTMSSSGDCIEYDPSSQIYTLEPCSQNNLTYCPATFQANSACQAPKPVNLGYPGQSCKNSEDCFSENCEKGYCVGVSEKESCSQPKLYSADVFCNPGLYCDTENLLCESLGLKGDACENDYQCTYGTGCLDGICYPLGGLFVGQQISPYYCLNYYSKFCEDLQCYIFANNTAVCTSVFTSFSSIPISCEDNNGCVSVPNYVLGASAIGTCTCSYNAEGTSFCPLFLGDAFATKYEKILRKWEQSEFISNCNIDIVYSPQCVSSYWKKSLTAQFYYYQFMAYNFIQMIGSSDCVQDIYFSSYARLANAVDSASGLVVFTVLILSLLV